MNQVALSARIVEASTLRYTPAGLPALDLTLEHESEILEAGISRQVKLTIRAVAFGAQAEALAGQAIGNLLRLQGFLATARGGKHPVLHVQGFQQA